MQQSPLNSLRVIAMAYKMLLLALAVVAATSNAQYQSEVFVSSTGFETESVPQDWLVHDITTPTGITKPSDSLISMTNGLVRRDFALVQDASTGQVAVGTISYRSLSRRAAILRAVSPEAVLTLDDKQYTVGGLQQTQGHAYLDMDNLSLGVDTSAFTFSDWSTEGNTDRGSADIPWTPGTRFAPSDVSWPPKGSTLKLHFTAPPDAPDSHKQLNVTVNYAIYEGIPLISKWVSVSSTQDVDVVVKNVVVELLSVNNPYGTDDGFLVMQPDTPHTCACTWLTDPQSSAQPGSFEPMVNCSYTSDSGAHVGRGSDFQSFRVLQLVTDSTDKERSGLSRRRMIRLLAPWTMENPIFMHNTDASPQGSKNAADQMAEVGFEMMIYSFGSQFVLETTNQTYLQQLKQNIDYAKSKGLEVGGYDLIVLDRGHGGYGGNVGDEYDCLDASTMQPTDNACFASGWYDKLDSFTKTMVEEVGMTAFETDGPYGGSSCASNDHAHHKGLEDSVYQQTRQQADYFAKLRSNNVYIHQPDDYFYFGGSKTGMGYNENQYSLPRWQDLHISRQSIYYDTYHMTVTQGWMFLPLVVYHGGGDAAMFEPLEQNLDAYEWGLAQYLGLGVAACYRGPRLYDTDKTKAVVKKWVDFYKKYRDILISDLVHVKEPTMQDVDCMMHVNSKLDTPGLAMVFNPTQQQQKSVLTLPVYYTGLSDRVTVSEQGQEPKVLEVDSNFDVHVELDMAPMSITWFVLSKPTQ